MTGTRLVCGWCPTELPDDDVEWYAHFLVQHGVDGYSIRHYPAVEFDEEVGAIYAASGSKGPTSEGSAP